MILPRGNHSRIMYTIICVVFLYACVNANAGRTNYFFYFGCANSRLPPTTMVSSAFHSSAVDPVCIAFFLAIQTVALSVIVISKVLPILISFPWAAIVATTVDLF